MARENVPLADLRVVEIAKHTSAAALCGRILVDLGADVVMLELSGEGQISRRGVAPTESANSYRFEFVAAGKRSVILLDETDKGLSEKFVLDLLELADVLVVDQDGLTLLRNLSIEIGRLVGEISHLVVCCLTPFGLTGPWSERPATEIILEAVAGTMLANGYPEDPPVKAGIPIAKSGGALLAVLSVMAAVYERISSGLGQLIDLSQFDILLTLQGTLLPSYFITGRPFRRVGNRHVMAAPWNAFKTLDGWIVVCTMGQSQWKALTVLIGEEQLFYDERFLDAELRVRNIAELDPYIERWVSARTSTEAVQALDAAGIPTGPILPIDLVLADHHTEFRRLCIKDGFRVLPGSIIKFGHPDSFVPAPSPELGRAKMPWKMESRSPWINLGRNHYDAQTTSAGDTTGEPLSGVRIVEIGSFTAGPLAGRLLGMLGAEVVKVEPPKGEGSRQLAQRLGDTGYLYFINNTDKFGCTLALESKEDRERFLDLLGSSDALITNLSKEMMDRYGLSFEDVKDIFPGLVYCSVTGYGLYGPNGGRKAFDTVIQATSGIMSLTGFPSEPPLKVAMSVADVMGACLGATSVVAGLLRRVRFGGGGLLDASMHDVAVWATQYAWPELLARGDVPSRIGNKDIMACPNDCYDTQDRPVVISVETEEQWHSLARMIGRDDLAHDPKFSGIAARQQHCRELDLMIAGWARDLASATVVSECIASGVPAAVPAELGEVVSAEQTVVREMIVSQEHPKFGQIKVIGCPFKFSRSRASVKRLAPDLGEHNDKYFHDRSDSRY